MNSETLATLPTATVVTIMREVTTRAKLEVWDAQKWHWGSVSTLPMIFRKEDLPAVKAAIEAVHGLVDVAPRFDACEPDRWAGQASYGHVGHTGARVRFPKHTGSVRVGFMEIQLEGENFELGMGGWEDGTPSLPREFVEAADAVATRALTWERVAQNFIEHVKFHEEYAATPAWCRNSFYKFPEWMTYLAEK